MKIKNFSKKLVLNKATVINLPDGQMRAAQGGQPLTSFDIVNQCYTNCPTGICCPVLISQNCPPTN